MKKFHTNTVKGLAFSASAIALVMGAPALAQDAEEPAEEVVEEEEEEQVDITTGGAVEEEFQGGITVTGSRIVRDTYSSISPLQVITTEQSRDVGLFDPVQILQRDESAAGQQIDATFQGFVLDNGPGSATLNLRGLGADRTLLLVNGRRLAPAGVEGAPVNPSINLLPASLIDRFDLLLDGASSIYGSDAVAGVGNIILRKDFDGLELFARGEINPQGAGEDFTISGAYGINLDRGFVGLGVEYDYRDTIRFRDRDFFQGCNEHLEVDENGNIFTIDERTRALVERDSFGGPFGQITTSANSSCKIESVTGRFVPNNTFLNSVFFQRGDTFDNLQFFGLPGFATRENAFLDPLDFNFDGIRDVDDQDYNGSNADLSRVFLSQQKLFNAMAYGEYTLPGAANLTPYFEANYSRARIRSDNAFQSFLFPDVPAENQFNPCNIDAGGADCRAIDNALFAPFSGGVPIWGPGGFFPGEPTGVNVSVFPIISVEGDRNNVDVTQEQYRGVLGIKGDLPFIGSSWKFDASFVYSRSEGASVRRGVREDRLAFALGIDPTIDFNGDGIIDNTGDGIADDYSDLNQFGVFYGDPGITPCDASALANPTAAADGLIEGCVPVNLFAPSLLATPIGDFATQAERDYLFGERSFDTVYEQKILSAFVTGNLFELQGGPVGAVVGAEYRKDSIDSDPNQVASNGLFFAFSQDLGAVGDKYIVEGFGELDLPLMAGKKMVEELTVNLSGRVTKEEFYGTNFTYSIKGGWRPVAPLLFKFSYGTSFRAPNLRENFLQAQQGFLTLFDPCAVPNEAFELGVGYVAANETRPDEVLQNCEREGRDPTQVGLAPNTQPVQNTSVRAISGGTFDIDPETSRSITAGFAFEEVIGDGFDVNIGLNYYDIKVKDSIIEPAEQFVINDCFLRTDGTRSPFCDRLTYDPLNGVVNSFDRGLIDTLSSEFLNFDLQNVRGMDINASFGKEWPVFGKFVDFGLDIRANRLLERSTTFINDNGDIAFDDDVGELGLPKWSGRAIFTADVDNLRLTYQLRYTGKFVQDIDNIDAFADVFQNGPDGIPVAPNGDLEPNRFSNTCLGAGDVGVEGDGVFCRNVGFGDDQFLHTVSLRYRKDNFTIIAGIDNIFDTAPPQIDSAEGPAIANTAIGAGYDYDGREFFASIQYNF
ncbi:TonB-dependent receptor domain-containing protein [Altererythrobacter lutimaris]|uniref:TonB-dependent receptor n=1 Tax=Altererythrobacter lutimaris TaxID=2743979 RepID=A0A850HAK6_9SPHN|nr:TonB-dependent receptor [Altererythrobacter lutimaris]NVE94759.1 TonB-dependent receptor [Altererythrobacter lutimaris]